MARPGLEPGHHDFRHGPDGVESRENQQIASFAVDGSGDLTIWAVAPPSTRNGTRRAASAPVLVAGTLHPSLRERAPRAGRAVPHAPPRVALTITPRSAVLWGVCSAGGWARRR